MRARRLAIAVIVAICVGAPIAEIFDQWDHTYQDGNDTELNLVAVALCVGVGLAAAGAVVAAAIRPGPSRARSSGEAVVCAPRPASTSIRPVPTSSPPIPLRI